ncbi:MAG: cadherin-like domain-containing protein [Candidatus Accumulibacter sp.]|nr:cadherin-like domain-containing protein [Candidatus Accumulibacter propinquus]
MGARHRTQPGSVVVNADGSFTYTPDADYHGPDSLPTP